MEKLCEQQQQDEEKEGNDIIDNSLLNEYIKKRCIEEEIFVKMMNDEQKKSEHTGIEGVKTEFIEYSDKYHTGYKVTKKITTITKIVGNKIVEETFTETNIKEQNNTPNEICEESSSSEKNDSDDDNETTTTHVQDTDNSDNENE